MTIYRVFRFGVASACVLSATSAEAHAFVQPYTLPVPLSMYAYGVAAALLLSFLCTAFVSKVAVQHGVLREGSFDSNGKEGVTWGVTFGRVVALGLLSLAICTGLFGSQNVFANFNMTFFWIAFVLGVPYLVILVGDFYSSINPFAPNCSRLSHNALFHHSFGAGSSVGQTDLGSLWIRMGHLWNR